MTLDSKQQKKPWGWIKAEAGNRPNPRKSHMESAMHAVSQITLGTSNRGLSLYKGFFPTRSLRQHRKPQRNFPGSPEEPEGVQLPACLSWIWPPWLECCGRKTMGVKSRTLCIHSFKEADLEFLQLLLVRNDSSSFISKRCKNKLSPGKIRWPTAFILTFLCCTVMDSINYIHSGHLCMERRETFGKMRNEQDLGFFPLINRDWLQLT